MPQTKQTCPCDTCPKAGDVFVCDDCKCTILVTRDCCCNDAACVSLACCGKAMCKAN